jgi:uncharacterized Rossmann fold enzyme
MSTDRINDMNLLSRLCNRAVLAHGDNLRKIETQVQADIEALPPARKKRLMDTLNMFLLKQSEHKGGRAH